MRAPRIGIIGARRRSQGIGQHVARHLAALGGDVVAIVGTRPESVTAAQRELSDRYTLQTRGYQSVEAMLASEELDAIAICSPPEFHRVHLHAALEHGVHVLCEKPLLFESGRDPEADARPIIEAFAASGKVLMANEQWPYTLSSFAELHPAAGLFKRPCEALDVLLAPAETGLAMIPSALPHVLSLLLALTPGGGAARAIKVACRDSAAQMSLAFDYLHHEGVTHVSCLFRQALEQPRPAGYAINGHGARRVIDMRDYSMALESTVDIFAAAAAINHGPETARRLPIEDPLVLLLRDFLARIEIAQRRRPINPILLDSMRLLREVHAAAGHQLATTDDTQTQASMSWTTRTPITTSAAS